VQHRVDEIRCISNRDFWRHCPCVANPADLPSQSVDAVDLLTINYGGMGVGTRGRAMIISRDSAQYIG